MKHPKHDAAVLILRDGQRRGLPVTHAVDFLLKKGMTTDQVLEAINEATFGTLVAAALGKDDEENI